MYEKLSAKAKKLLDKKNKSPLAKFFQETGYVQDKEWRRVQVLFLKLLMAAAYADEELDEDELDIIKDYAYENSLTEDEWREIDFFRAKKATDEEIRNIAREITSELKSKKQRNEILAALKEVIESDDIVKEEESNILKIIEDEMDSNPGIFKRLARGISNGLEKKRKGHFSGTDAAEYSKNPIVPILKEMLGDRNKSDIEIMSAALGLAVALIHADMEFHDDERAALYKMIEKECSVDTGIAESIGSRISEIPDTFFEIAYLGRTITDSNGMDRRIDILSSLFDIAYADRVYDPAEDNYLKIISKYLMINHNNFIAIKLDRRK